MDEMRWHAAVVREALTGLLAGLDPVGVTAEQWQASVVEVEAVG